MIYDFGDDGRYSGKLYVHITFKIPLIFLWYLWTFFISSHFASNFKSTNYLHNTV